MMIAWLLVAQLSLATGFTTSGGTMTAWFSPRGGCTGALVTEINKASDTVLVEAYSLTSSPIIASLRDAHRRGVHVEVIVDPTTARYVSAAWNVSRGETVDINHPLWLDVAGVTLWVDGAHAIMHDKVVLVDGRVLITGSFNFSRAAEERNAENLLVIRNVNLATRYAQEWRSHRDHSARF
jgi:phosphatidylserine/phosphatidylglycerophosphate/cardiolipin synthase-like enzyme